MKTKALALVAALSLAAAPAFAGNLSYIDGRGGWISTQCNKPQRPADLPQNSNAPASDLNERIEAYNLYTAQTQTYLDCLTGEIERDAQAAQQVLTRDGQKAIKASQDELTALQSQLQRKKKK